MRLSLDKNDRAYRGSIGIGATVYIDGEKAERVITADEESGELVVVQANDKGDVLVRNGEIQTETRRGKVVIVLPEGLEFLRDRK